MTSVNFEQCQRTKVEILNKITTGLVCHVCKLIPIPLIRDGLNPNLVYCTECAVNYKIKKTMPTHEDKSFLDGLLIDCKNNCGKTFTYNTFEVFQEHEITCNFGKRNKKLENNCFKCGTLSKGIYHDCLIKTKMRITSLEKMLIGNFEIKVKQNEKRLLDIESNINGKNNLINESQKEKDKIAKELSSIKQQIETDRLNSAVKISQFDAEIMKINSKLSSAATNTTNTFNDEKQMSYINSKLNEIENKTKALNQDSIQFKNDFKEFSQNINDKINNLISDFKSINSKSIDVNQQKKTNELPNKTIPNAKNENLNKRNPKSLIESDQFVASQPSQTPRMAMFGNSLFGNQQNMFGDPNLFGGSLLNNNLMNLGASQNLMRQQGDISNKDPILNGNISTLIENAHSGLIINMIIHQDKLVSTSQDGSIKIWNLNNYTLEKEIEEAHDGSEIYSLLVSKEEKLLISGGMDSKIRFWDKKYKEKVKEIIDNQSGVLHMLEAYDNLIVTSTDFIIYFYKLKTRSRLTRINAGSPISLTLFFGHDLFCGFLDGTIKSWKVNFNYISSINDNTVNKFQYHEESIVALLNVNINNKEILISTDSSGTIIFSSFYEKFQIIKQYDIEDYDENPDRECGNFMHVYLLKKSKILISITSGSSLLFWNLNDFAILRNVKFHKRLNTVIGLENDAAIVFSQGESNIVIWK